MKSKKPALLSFLYLISLILIILFFYLPVINLFISGFSPEEMKDFASKGYYSRVILFSVKQAALSTFFSVIIGFPGAYILSHYSFPGKNFIKALITVPFVLPPIAAVLGIVLLTGNNGIINRILMEIFDLEKPPLRILYSFKAIIAAHTFYNIPLFARFVYPVWAAIPSNLAEAGKSLGAGKFRLFRTVTLPYIKESVTAAASLIFVLCFMSFSLVLVLGGGPKCSTIEVEIYKLVKTASDISGACTLGIIESSITLLFISLYTICERKETKYEIKGTESTGYKRAEKKLKNIPLFLYLFFLTLFIALPLITILFNSLRSKQSWGAETELTLNWYRSFAHPSMYIPISNTLFLACSSALCSIVLSVPVSFFIKRSKKAAFFIKIFFFSVLGISSIILGSSYINLAASLKIHPNGKFLLIAAHTASVLPYTIKSIALFYGRINESCIESARSLGAGSFRIFRTIELPVIKNGIMTAGIFAFAVSAGEINSALMLAPEGFATIPIAIYRLIGAYRFYQACAMGTVLILICISAFYIIDKLGDISI